MSGIDGMLRAEIKKLRNEFRDNNKKQFGKEVS